MVLNLIILGTSLLLCLFYNISYTKTKYNGDLKIVNDRSTIEITNYGRCFLDIDAYYVITLANVDNLNETCTITLRYENEET